MWDCECTHADCRQSILLSITHMKYAYLGERLEIILYFIDIWCLHCLIGEVRLLVINKDVQPVIEYDNYSMLLPNLYTLIHIHNH